MTSEGAWGFLILFFYILLKNLGIFLIFSGQKAIIYDLSKKKTNNHLGLTQKDFVEKILNYLHSSCLVFCFFFSPIRPLSRLVDMGRG